MTNVRLSLMILFLLINYGLKAQNKDSIAVMKSVNNFVTAFNHFNWDSFRESFTDDATIFYPYWNQANGYKADKKLKKPG